MTTTAQPDVLPPSLTTCPLGANGRMLPPGLTAASGLVPLELDFPYVQGRGQSGLVVAWLSAAEHGGHADLLGLLAGKAEAPHRRAGAAVQSNPQADRFVAYAGLTLPVTPRDAFEIAFEKGLGVGREVRGQASLMPFTGWGIALGERRPLAGGELQTAATDGLVVVSLLARDGERGSAVGRQGAELHRVAGCAVHWESASDTTLRQASFCMPVPQGTPFRIDIEATAGQPVVTAEWIPLAPGPGGTRHFGALQPASLATLHQAPSDGLVLATLQVQSPGDRGSLLAACDSTDSELDEPDATCAATSVQYSPASDVWALAGSLLFPVVAGDFWRVRAVDVAGEPEAQVLWLPMVG